MKILIIKKFHIRRTVKRWTRKLRVCLFWDGESTWLRASTKISWWSLFYSWLGALLEHGKFSNFLTTIELFHIKFLRISYILFRFFFLQKVVKCNFQDGGPNSWRRRIESQKPERWPWSWPFVACSVPCFMSCAKNEERTQEECEFVLLSLCADGREPAVIRKRRLGRSTAAVVDSRRKNGCGHGLLG